MTDADLSLPMFSGDCSDAIAIDDGGDCCSYVELSKIAARSHLARDAGVGERLAFLGANDFSTLATFWSTFAAGAIACPISHRLPRAERERLVADLGARWIKPTDPRRDHLFGKPVNGRPGAGTIIHTSGSSGVPKPVVHNLRAHVANAVGAAKNIPLSVGDRWLWSLPSFHVSGFSILIRCAAAGATLVIDDRPLSAGLLNNLSITHLSLVPTQLQRLLRSSLASGEPFPNRTLKAALLGGAAAPTHLIDESLARGVPLHVTYGMTEMGSQITATSVDDPSSRISQSVGRVLDGREVRIADGAEILVRGEPLCLGYDDRGTVRTAADDDGWFHTGDLGRLDEAGYLHLTGRQDNMFISGGENIHPEMIEKALLQLVDIQQAIVVPRDDKEFGKRPVAFVEAVNWNPEAWKFAARERLAGFAVPAEFLPWPREAADAVKPSRMAFANLAAEKDGDC